MSSQLKSITIASNPGSCVIVFPAQERGIAMASNLDRSMFVFSAQEVDIIMVSNLGGPCFFQRSGYLFNILASFLQVDHIFVNMKMELNDKLLDH